MKKLSTYSCFWSNQSENNWISSAGKTIELKTNAINPYIEIKEKYKKIQPMISIYSFGLNNEKPNPLGFSGFSFETKILNKQDIWHDFPNGLVTLPTYTIEHKNDKTKQSNKQHLFYCFIFFFFFWFLQCTCYMFGGL